ncbi:MAG: TonB-dependent receptor [Prevotella sp.]|nr:TonB-dependent receptor [Prevotella sp.]
MKRKLIISLCASAALALLPSVSLAQNQTVKGTVVDENGEPIIGATIQVTGQKTGGTVTDIDGNYELSVPADAKITVTYIGFVPQTVKPGGVIHMAEDRQSLEEVVVVGYGTQKMKNITGAVETITPKDIQDLSVGSLGDALVGMFNGVSVSANGYRPGQSPSLNIRQSDVLAKSTTPNATHGGSPDPTPLYVIDGFISNETAFNNLDISEVESITVLKDASAAVYGARAAYGVVLVKTKQGENGAPKISYSGQLGWTDALYKPKMLSSYDYMKVYNTMRAANTSSQESLEMRTQLFQADEMEAARLLNYNLLDKEWKASFTQRHNININGGTDKATYFAGVSYYKQDGNIGRLDYDRWNFRTGVNAKIGKHVKTALQVSGDWGERNNSTTPQGGGTDFDYKWLMTHLPFVPDYAGSYPLVHSGMENGIPTSATQLYNFAAVQNHSDNVQNQTNNLNINGSIELDFDWIKPLKGLSAKISYSKSISNSKNNLVQTIQDVYRMLNRTGSGNHLYTGHDAVYDDDNMSVLRLVSNGGLIRRDMARSDSYQYNFTLQYARQFGLHDVSGLFSLEKTEAWAEDLYGSITDLIAYQDGQFSSGTGDKDASGNRSESGMLSYVGRFNYAYASKYLFEFLFRADASTKFAPKNYWGKFPSVSAGWVISEENWFQNGKIGRWVDFLKIRASWGLMGRDNIRAWLWTQLYERNAAKGAIFGANGINSDVGYALVMPKAGVNSDVHWDKTYKTNVGIDAHFLRDRLTLEFNYYYDRGRELFATRTGTSLFPTTVGTQATPENYGELDAWGWELNLGWRDKIGKDINYWVKLSTGFSDNKILKTNFQAIPEYDDMVYGERTDRGLWGFKCLGMFRSYQDIEEYFSKYNITEYMGMTKSEVRPGMLIYEDIQGDNNGDGTYGPRDGKVTAGNDYVRLSEYTSNPYGCTLNFGISYKSFSLQAQLGASWGAKAMVGNDFRQAANNYEYENMPSSFSDMFNYEAIYDASGNITVPTNIDAYMPNMRYSNVNAASSSFWLIDATAITLRNITVAYTFPKKWVNYIGVSNVRLNLTVQNAINFINNYPDKSWASWAGSYGRYPNLRKFTMGINVSF